MHPDEIKWMQKLDFIRLSFCKNLHAKCYLNESECIISSLNLYEFSQINNNEMGILIHKYEDQDVFQDAYEESQRIIRISDEVRISLDEVKTESINESNDDTSENNVGKLTSSKLAAKHKIKTNELLAHFTEKGFLNINDAGKHILTQQGKDLGAEFKTSQYGGYFIWPENIEL